MRRWYQGGIHPQPTAAVTQWDNLRGDDSIFAGASLSGSKLDARFREPTTAVGRGGTHDSRRGVVVIVGAGRVAVPWEDLCVVHAPTIAMGRYHMWCDHSVDPRASGRKRPEILGCRSVSSSGGGAMADSGSFVQIVPGSVGTVCGEIIRSHPNVSAYLPQAVAIAGLQGGMTGEWSQENSDRLQEQAILTHGTQSTLLGGETSHSSVSRSGRRT